MSNDDAQYQHKNIEYFGNVRKEILEMLPDTTNRVFEVGCGSGDTLAFLKHEGICKWAGGIELHADAAQLAQQKLDLILRGNIESIEIPLPENSIDVILCLDVLEHLTDPWSVLARLQSLLKRGGILICSVPNVRYFKVTFPLLLLGRWQYSEEGVLDRTHLRFFTKDSAVELVGSSGLKVDKITPLGLEKWNKPSIVNLLTLNVFKSFFHVQYLIRSVNK